MLRLTFAARIALIVLLSLAAMWVATIAYFYRSHSDEAERTRPPPDQIGALAGLLESTSPEVRPLVLAAVNTPRFAARLENDPPSALARPGETTPDARIREAYAAALAGRAVTIVVPPPAGPTGLFPRLTSGAANALEFRIALRTGQTLVVDASSPVVVTRFGLPVGFGAGLFGTFIALAALIVMQSQTRPLARLAAAVDRVDLSVEPQPLPETRRSAPEIRALVKAFNRLQGRLGDMLRARMAMLGGISHDVRTFATRLRMRVDRIPDDAERGRAIADIDDMIRLLDDALLTGRAGAGALTEEMVEFDQIVRKEVADRRAQGAVVDIRSDVAVGGSIVLGDRLALRRIVANVTDNAIKYGGAAHLTTMTEGATVVLMVDDEGSGIPAAEREGVFQPFTRLEPSRNRGTGGAGLGLAVARSLAEAHGGTIVVDDAPGTGARVIVRLPIFRPS